MKRILSLLIFLLPLAITAKVWTPESLPMTHLQDKHRYTCNPDSILAPMAVYYCDSLAYDLERRTGIEFVIVCIENIEGDDPYSFNKELFQKYGIGKKGADNGLVLTLASKDRSYFCSVGKGLEGILPDAIVKRMENTIMMPLLKKGDWNNAIVQIVANICNFITETPEKREELATMLKQADAEAEGGNKEGSNWWKWFMGILAVGGAAYLAWFNGLFDSKEEKDRRRKAEEEKKKKEFDNTHTDCPKCGGKQTLELRKFKFERGNDAKLHKFGEWKCSSCGHEEVMPEDTSWTQTGRKRDKATRLCPHCGDLGKQTETDKQDFKGENDTQMCRITWTCNHCNKKDVEEMTKDEFLRNYIISPMVLHKAANGTYFYVDEEEEERERKRREREAKRKNSRGSSSSSSGGSFGGGSYGGGGAGGRF